MPEHIIMTAGAGAAINAIMKCLLDPGDEIIVFAPYFVEYSNWTRTFGTETIVVPPNEKGGFQPDIETMKSLINEKTKAVLVNNPNNPTGVIYTRESIQALADALYDAEERIGHPIYIISDEPYRELVYDGTEVPHIPAYYDNTLIAYSWSKSLSMPGDRIGYVAVSPKSHEATEMIDALIIANRVCGVTNGPTIQELIVERCIDARVDLSYYKKNRDDLYNIVKSAGFTAVMPQGAFYLWIKSPVEDEREVVEAAKKEGILIVPGRSFASPGWMRASFCISNDIIKRSENAFRRLGEKFFG